LPGPVPRGAGGVLATLNILGSPFCLLKKYEPKENLLIGSPWNYYYYYYYYYYFFLWGNYAQLIYILKEKLFKIGMMHFLREKCVRLGG
jgi:hypothetical protein